jgi:hypothetical protein
LTLTTETSLTVSYKTKPLFGKAVTKSLGELFILNEFKSTLLDLPNWISAITLKFIPDAQASERSIKLRILQPVKRAGFPIEIEKK